VRFPTLTYKKLSLLFLLIPSLVFGDVSGGVSNPKTFIEEQDGSPSNVYWKLIFPNNCITDNGDNTASLNTVTEAHITNSYLKLDQSTPQTVTGGAPNFSAGIDFTQIATPSNPAAGSNRLYFKNDDKLYQLTSGGAESLVGGSSISFGSAGQIPYTNATTDDFSYGAGLSWDSATSTLTATNIVGDLTGNVTGNVSGNASTATSASSAASATNAANTAITDDTTTNAIMYPTWVTANTGNLPQKVSSTKLSFNPSSGLLTATGFSGPLTGNVTGNVSGNAGTVTNGVYTTDAGTVFLAPNGDGQNLSNVIHSESDPLSATKALDNIASCAINTSLLSDTADTDSLGSADKEWLNLYIGDAGKIYLGLGQDTSIHRSGANEMTLTASSGVKATNFISTASLGTSPYACTSTTLNTNLNSDYLDGQHGSYYAPLSDVLKLDQTTPQTVTGGAPNLTGGVDTVGIRTITTGMVGDSAVDSSGNIWYATAAGLMKSTDGGLTGTLKDPIANSMLQSAILIANNGNIIWGPWNYGKFRLSTDGGNTWSDVGSYTAGAQVSGPWGRTKDDLGYLYFGIYTSTGVNQQTIHRSTDNGATWSVVFTGVGQHIHDVAADPYQAGYVYASCDPGTTGDDWRFIRSTDNGANWETIITGSGILKINFLSDRRLVGEDGNYGRIWSTTDDATFTEVYRTGTVIEPFTTVTTGGRIYYGFVGKGTDMPRIISTANGTDWRVEWIGTDLTVWSGIYGMSANADGSINVGINNGVDLPFRFYPTSTIRTRLINSDGDITLTPVGKSVFIDGGVTIGSSHKLPVTDIDNTLLVENFINTNNGTHTSGKAHYQMSNGYINRWAWGLKTAETGSNAGSDICLFSYQDNGNYLGEPLTITRSTGAINLKGATTINNNSSTGLLVERDGVNDNVLVVDTMNGNVGIGTSDFDGTPATGKLVVKGTTNNGSTNIFVGRDSDEANVATLDTDGNIITSGSAQVGGATGAKLSAASGVLTMAGVGGTNNENLTFNFESLSNTVQVNSSSSVDNIGLVDLLRLNFGTGLDVAFVYQTQGNDNLQLGITCGSADDSGYFSIMERADIGNANRSPSGTSADPVLRIYSSDAGVAADYLEFYHNQTNPVINAGNGALILSGANVLINSTDDDGTPPTGKLVVKGSTNDGSTNIFVGRDSDNANVATLDTDGNLMLGLSSSNTRVYFQADTDQWVGSIGNGLEANYYGRGNIQLRWNTCYWANAGVNEIVLDSSTHVQMPQYGAGTATFGSTGIITSTSDERLKDIQGSFTRGLKDLEGIRPIFYKWNDKSGMNDDTIYAGFSAQNIQKNIPEAVGQNPEGYLSLQDRPILATLVNAVKEQQKQIDDLKSRIEKLEANQ